MSEFPDDFELLNDCINGEKEAWDIFVTRFSKLIYYSINKTLKSHACNLHKEDVEDVYNSIFLSFMENNYKKLRQFEGKQGCTLSSWIRLISIRHIIDFLRSQKHHVSMNDDSDGTQPLVEALPDKGESCEEQIELSETERALKEAIDTLPSSDRLFMELFFEKELPPEEIAGIMNVSVNTIYSKKNRVREKIIKILSGKGVIARNSD